MKTHCKRAKDIRSIIDVETFVEVEDEQDVFEGETYSRISLLRPL